MLVLLAASSAPASAAAPVAAPKSDYPNRQITLIVGYEPGGMSDVICRLIANYMAPILKKSVIIENLPGASTMVALNALLGRKSDGYTITMCATADSPWAYEITKAKDINWKASDFTVIARGTQGPAAMGLVGDKKKWETLPDFIEDARSKPAKTYNVGILGPGRLDEPQLAELEKAFGVKFNVALYGSSAAVQTDIMTGDLDAGVFGCNRDNMVDNPNFQVLGLYGSRATIPSDFPGKGLPLVGDFEKELNFNYSEFKYVPLMNGTTSLICDSKMDKSQVAILRDACKKVCDDPNFKADEVKLGGLPGYMDDKEMVTFWTGVQDAMKAAMVPSDAKIAPVKPKKQSLPIQISDKGKKSSGDLNYILHKTDSASAESVEREDKVSTRQRILRIPSNPHQTNFVCLVTP